MRTEEFYIDGETTSEDFNLLYPPRVRPDQQGLFLELDSVARHDLDIEHVIFAFTADREHRKEIQRLFSHLPCDPEVISYRRMCSMT